MIGIKRIAIVVDVGFPPNKIEIETLYEIGNFFVHSCQSGHPPGSKCHLYTVSHDSGLSVRSGIYTFDDAKEIAKMFARSELDWDIQPHETTKLHGKIGKAILARFEGKYIKGHAGPVAYRVPS